MAGGTNNGTHPMPLFPQRVASHVPFHLQDFANEHSHHLQETLHVMILMVENLDRLQLLQLNAEVVPVNILDCAIPSSVINGYYKTVLRQFYEENIPITNSTRIGKTTTMWAKFRPSHVAFR